MTTRDETREEGRDLAQEEAEGAPYVPFWERRAREDEERVGRMLRALDGVLWPKPSEEGPAERAH